MSRREVAQARGLCRSCPVRRDCLFDALHAGTRFGVWGGLTDAERQRAYTVGVPRGFRRTIAGILRLFDQGLLERLVIRL